jgi:hypothetical protein
MGALQGKLWSAFVVFLAQTALAAPPMRDGDCGVLGADVSPFAKGDIVSLRAVEAGRAWGTWSGSLAECVRRTRFAGWIKKDEVRSVFPMIEGQEFRRIVLKNDVDLRDKPGGKTVGHFTLTQKIYRIDEKDDWMLVSSKVGGPHAPRDASWVPTEGWISKEAIRYVKLGSTGGIPGLSITPAKVTFSGHGFAREKICSDRPFTEVATYLWTFDSARPLAILCGGFAEEEKSVLTLLGRDGRSSSTELEPADNLTVAGDRAVLGALDRMLVGSGK